MNTDTYHYRLNRTYRENVMRTVRRNHLLHIATERHSNNRRTSALVLLTFFKSLFQ